MAADANGTSHHSRCGSRRSTSGSRPASPAQGPAVVTSRSRRVLVTVAWLAVLAGEAGASTITAPGGNGSGSRPVQHPDEDVVAGTCHISMTGRCVSRWTTRRAAKLTGTRDMRMSALPSGLRLAAYFERERGSRERCRKTRASAGRNSCLIVVRRCCAGLRGGPPALARLAVWSRWPRPGIGAAVVGARPAGVLRPSTGRPVQAARPRVRVAGGN